MSPNEMPENLGEIKIEEGKEKLMELEKEGMFLKKKILRSTKFLSGDRPKK